MQGLSSMVRWYSCWVPEGATTATGHPLTTAIAALYLFWIPERRCMSRATMLSSVPSLQCHRGEQSARPMAELFWSSARAPSFFRASSSGRSYTFLDSRNLVSVSKLTELDYVVEFLVGGQCLVRDVRPGAGGAVVGRGRRMNGIYELDYLEIPLNRSPTMA